MKITRGVGGAVAIVVVVAVPAAAYPMTAPPRATTAPTAGFSSAAGGCEQQSSSYVQVGTLDGVQFVSATTGWVVGANRVLATTDGGGHWSVQRRAPKADYSEVDAIDADDAWVVGSRSLIVTTDGGASWRSLPEPCPAVSSVHFVSSSNGFAVSGSRLLRTVNGGSTWRHVASPPRVLSVCFTDTQRGWLGAHGRIYRTLNGGRSWTLAVAGPRPNGPNDDTRVTVQCSGPDSGWAEMIPGGAGMNQQAHIGYYLSDSGSRPVFAEQQFRHPGVRVSRGSPGGQPATFSAIDQSDAVFVDACTPCGDFGLAPMGVVTRDGLAMRRAGYVPHVNDVIGASFVSTTDGWATGYVIGFPTHSKHQRLTPKIVHTTDGGRHWTTQYVG
jgi:Photosynthesis system II assembly factor YCF48